MRRFPVWGVDLSSTAVRAVQLRTDGTKSTLTGWDVVDFTEEVADPTSLQRYALMGRSVYRFRSSHKLHRCHVWASLRGETAFNRTVLVPPVNDESLDKIMEYEAQQQVPHPLDEVFWDRRVIDIQPDGGVTATLYAVRKSIVEDRLRKLAKAGLPVDGLQLRPLATHNYCAFEGLLEQGTIVIDVDYMGLQVLVHHDDQSWFRVLPVGGVDLVARVRETFEVDHRTAVKLITGQATPPDATLLDACRREVAQDLVEEAANTIRYYLAAKPAVRPSSVILLEAHPCVPPMQEALKRNLDLPVFVPRSFRNLEVDPAVESKGLLENFGGVARAVGLALQGVSAADVDVRLFPADLARPIGSRKTGYWVAAAAILVAVGFAGWRYRRAATELQDLRTAVADVRATGRDLVAVEEAAGLSEPRVRLGALAYPAAGRWGPQGLITSLQKMVVGANPRASLVSVDWAASEPRRARIILAVCLSEVSTGDEPTTDAWLLELARTLIGTSGVSAVAPGAAWTHGTLSNTPPVRPLDRPLRLRFRHRAFELTLMGES